MNARCDMSDNIPVPKFNRDKFRDVVHYICANCEPAELGNVKLHKILYFADMLKFMDTLEPLTGVEYQKQKFGPVARHLTWAVDELCREGLLRVERRQYFGYTKLDYISQVSPNTNRLTNEEVDLLNDVIAYVCSKSAKEISELSHDVAWEAARIGEIIPYYAALGLLPEAVTDADVKAAVEEARRIRPVIDAERTSC